MSPPGPETGSTLSTGATTDGPLPVPDSSPGPAVGLGGAAAAREDRLELPSRGSVYCRVLACDFDGTLTQGGSLAPEVARVLADARATGLTTILVTGRVLEDLRLAQVDTSCFDAVVAENGALVWLVASGRVLQLGVPPTESFFGELRARGIPFHAGTVVVGTTDRHAAELLELVRRHGLDSQIVFNRAAVMLLPSGVDKAAGVRRAMEELGRSERNLVALGDAENDLPLLRLAQIGVAARGSVAAVAQAADDRLSQADSAGAVQYIRRLIASQGMLPRSERHWIPLGTDGDGLPVSVPGSGTNIMISGDPRSGKSWLAGLLAERLIEARYRVCIIDPEGDHLLLGRSQHALALGDDIPLPDATAVPRILRDGGMSLVLNLSALRQREKLDYADQVLRGLEPLRTETGIPHWTIVEEAHYFFAEGARGNPASTFAGRTGNLVFVSYRPSLISREVHDSVDTYLLTRTAIEEERYFVTSMLQARAPRELIPHDALGALESRRAGLLLAGCEGPRWQIFTPIDRASPHVHHGRKYADSPLPEERAFRFLAENGSVLSTAHNVAEFCFAVASVPLESLRHHLLAGDFSRWVVDVLGDRDLAAGLRKLERTVLEGARPSRDEIIQHVRDRYFI